MALAQVLGGDFRHGHLLAPSPLRSSLPRLPPSRVRNRNTSWDALQSEVGRRGRFSCLFSDGSRKQEQARKALESALEGKKSDFEKWNKEIKRRTENGGGGISGRGGWFGGGGWFHWFNDEHFWAEAQQAILTILGIVLLFLLLTKGNVMFALVFNSLLFVLRGARNWLTFVSERLPGFSTPVADQSMNDSFQNKKSAKDSVVSKWGTN